VIAEPPNGRVVHDRRIDTDLSGHYRLSHSMGTHLADSTAQQDAESDALLKACAVLGLDTDLLQCSPDVVVAPGVSVRPDGWVCDPQPRVALEVYSKMEKPKGGQAHKVRTDLLKLILLRNVYGTNLAGYFVVTSKAVEQWATAGWTGEVLRRFGIGLLRVELSEAARERLGEAVKRQQRGNVMGE